MLKIEKGAAGQTVLTTFEVTPGTCEDLLMPTRRASPNNPALSPRACM